MDVRSIPALSPRDFFGLPRDLFGPIQDRRYNDTLRHSERRRVFDVSELKRLAALSVQQQEGDVVKLEKLAEGGFNRSFLLTMRNGFKLVARIPYPVTEPKSLVIASEVATMDFLRSHGIPIPKIFGYSTVADNSVGSEYVFMEFVEGRNLGDIWFTLTGQERAKIVASLVQLETRLFALHLPAAGSIYYCDDLPDQASRVRFPSQSSVDYSRFCIGPDTSYGLWFGKRAGLSVDRGPYKDCTETLTAGAKKEMAYLKKFGRDLQPIQRLRREIYDYQAQSYMEHIANLTDYLKVAPHIIPSEKPALLRPVIRHPDPQPNNIFISDNLEINGLIDWQHCAVLPLFLQCGIPKSIQNYGDEVSESLQTPHLPANFQELDEIEQYREAELFRRRHIHYSYVKSTADTNAEHYDALSHDFSILRRRLFTHSSDPWEGDNVTLKADLIALSKNWKRMSPGVEEPCPLTYSEEESAEYLRLEQAQIEADEQLQACHEVIGVGNEGWVPVTQYEESKRAERKLKADALDAAESDEERRQVQENWVFDDFCEDDYM